MTEGAIGENTGIATTCETLVERSNYSEQSRERLRDFPCATLGWLPMSHNA
jgi:hypothetical protein